MEKNRNEVNRKDSGRAEVLNGDFINILALGCTENITPKIMLAVSSTVNRSTMSKVGA